MIAMMTQYPQLHGDVSTISWVLPRAAFYDYLEALVRAGLGKRVMFGSDQMRWPEKIGEGIDAIEQAPFLTRTRSETFSTTTPFASCVSKMTRAGRGHRRRKSRGSLDVCHSFGLGDPAAGRSRRRPSLASSWWCASSR
jgi:hypothetical protein